MAYKAPESIYALRKTMTKTSGKSKNRHAVAFGGQDLPGNDILDSTVKVVEWSGQGGYLLMGLALLLTVGLGALGLVGHFVFRDFKGSVFRPAHQDISAFSSQNRFSLGFERSPRDVSGSSDQNVLDPRSRAHIVITLGGMASIVVGVLLMFGPGIERPWIGRIGLALLFGGIIVAAYDDLALEWRQHGGFAVEGISTVRLTDGRSAQGAQVYDPRAPRRTQKTRSHEPEQTGSEAAQKSCESRRLL